MTGGSVSAGVVEPGEQITKRPPAPQSQSDPAPVFRAVMQQMAPLAECSNIAVPAPAMCRVMVEVGGRQHDLGRPHWHILGQGR